MPTHHHSSRNTHILLIALLFLLSPLHLLDLFPRFSTHVLGDVMDTAQYVQNVWWTAHALLDLRASPFRNDHMFHPFGFHMIQHNYNFLDGLLYTLSRSMVPLLVFHNALTWLSVFFNSLAAFWLILSVTGMASLAFIGALAFAHSPVLTSYHGAQSLLEPYMLVFFMLASLALFRSPGYRRAIGSGILLGLSVYTYPYYFVAGLVWLGVVLGYRLFPWTDGETGDAGPTRRFEPGMIGAWLLFALVLVLVLVPRDAWPFAVGRTLGLAVVTLALVGLAATAWSRARRRREGRRVQWRPPSGREVAVTLSVSAVLLATAALVALPFTHAYVSERTVRSALDSRSVDFLLYSVDLTAFLAPFHPWLTQAYRYVAADWTTNSPIVGTPAFLGWFWITLLVLGFGLCFRKPVLRLWLTGWTVFLFLCLGPYLKVHGSLHPSVILPAYIVPHLPLLASTRTLSRFVVPLTLLTIVVGCLVLKVICQARPRGWTPVIAVGVLVITTFEFALWPHPHQPRPTDYRVPAVYHALADQARSRQGVLLDLPLFSHSGSRSEGRGQTRWHYYQTVHQQKLVGGVASKLDDRIFRRFEERPGILALWARRPVSARELDALLTDLGVDWIVVNKSQYAPEVLTTYLGTLDGNRRVRRFYEDPEYLGLRVDRAS